VTLTLGGDLATFVAVFPYYLPCSQMNQLYFKESTGFVKSNKNNPIKRKFQEFQSRLVAVALIAKGKAGALELLVYWGLQIGKPQQKVRPKEEWLYV
jgi:hypothetical protein